MKQHRLLTDALRAAFPTAKHLAVAGDISVWTAIRYRRGETFPDAFTLARLMGKSRAVADAMLKLAGLDDLTLDLEQARLLRALNEIETKRAARHEALATNIAVVGRALPLASGGPGAAAGGETATGDRPAHGPAASRVP